MNLSDMFDMLTLDDLDEEQRELADCLGLDTYKKFILTYAGTFLSVRNPERVILPVRDRLIRKEFNGGNYNELALKYHLTNVRIRQIINGK